jgi:hypothetical protein
MAQARRGAHFIPLGGPGSGRCPVVRHIKEHGE